jgi:hypothetical protein
MVKIMTILFLFVLAGCGKCPQECTPEAISKCENQASIFKNQLTEKLSVWQPQIATYDASRGFYQPSFDSIVDDVVERNQSAWNANHISAYENLAENDLNLICKFATEDTFGHDELTNLASILQNVVNQQKVANENLLSQASSEAIAKIKETN